LPEDHLLGLNLRKRAQRIKDGAVAMVGASYDKLLWSLRQKR